MPRNSSEPTINTLRPSASESMPIKGDISATPITVAPTASPTCTSLACKSCIKIGKTACTEYTCKKANTPMSAMASSSSG